MFEKSFKRIIVQTIVLEQNRPVTLSFFFKKVVDVGSSLPSQLFEQIAVVDAPPLSTTIIDSTTDLLFEMIRVRTDVTEETMMASKA